MAVPDFQSMMLPLLTMAGDGAEHNHAEALRHIVAHFNVSPQDQQERLASGAQTRLMNRIYWARIHLARAGLLEVPRRGIFRITDRGREVLGGNPQLINMRFLRQYPEYLEFTRPTEKEDAQETETEGATQPRRHARHLRNRIPSYGRHWLRSCMTGLPSVPRLFSKRW